MKLSSIEEKLFIKVAANLIEHARHEGLDEYEVIKTFCDEINFENEKLIYEMACRRLARN